MEQPRFFFSSKQPRIDQGLYIVFEGLDGCGKTTQCQMLATTLQQRGHDVLQTREPTEGFWGQKIRQQIFRDRGQLTPEEELELFLLDRREHLQNLILPALSEGKTIIQDRYFLSTAAYQGSRGLDVQHILDLHQDFALLPDRIFLLEIPPTLSIHRIEQGRKEHRNAFEQLEDLQICGEIFSQLDLPGLCRLDGQLPPKELHQHILKEVEPLLLSI